MGTKSRDIWVYIPYFLLFKLIVNFGVFINKYVVNMVSDKVRIDSITITAPNKTVTTSLRGLAPKAETNSFLVTKNKATAASWEKVLIIDGGNASTTDWGTIS